MAFLTGAQIADLESRWPTLQADVIEFNVLTSSFFGGVYEQTPDDMSFLDWLGLGIVTSPIPPAGYWVNDPKYGIVVIFPDANGNLQFTTPPNGATGSALQLPATSLGASLLTAGSGLESIVFAGVLLLGAVYVLPLLSRGRPRSNPPRRGRTMIGDEVEEIRYRKGQDHDCDEECMDADHRYVHQFQKKMPMWGLRNGRMEI